MNMGISNKVFVVTGAGSGIGKALVIALIGKGAKVAAVDIHKETLLQLTDSVGTKHKHLSTHVVDISDKTSVKKLPDEILAKHRSIDAIINNAGIIQPFVTINNLEYPSIEKVFNINFYGTLYMTKTFLPYLLKRPEAYIVNVSSMGGFLPVPGQSAYGASKAAVKLLTEGLYAELLDTPVNVSIVFPGATQTNITQNSGVTMPVGATEQSKKFNMLSADAAAEIIVKGIEKNKPQIFVGKDSKMMNRLYRLNPVFATKLIAKQMKSLLQT